MYKILKADKDTYITDKVVNDSRSHGANVGIAGTLDLFKLYGSTVTGSLKLPNIELSRLLIHFDLTSLRTLVSENKIDVTNNSFFAKLKLVDVYGGQPTPDKFTRTISPLSKVKAWGTVGGAPSKRNVTTPAADTLIISVCVDRKSVV